MNKIRTTLLNSTNWVRGRKQHLAFFANWCKGHKTPWCDLLNNEVYIDPNGSVFSCCQYGPEPLGNIHTSTLQDIWNGKVLRHNRRLNVQGRLRCAEGCRAVVYWEDVSLQGRKEYDNVRVPYKNLKTLSIEFGYACNVRCIMCCQDHDDNNSKLDWDFLRDNIDYSDIELISVQGGEPFFIKDAREYIKWVATIGKRLRVLTNGTIMSRSMAETLMSNETDVVISINAATAAIHELVNYGSKWKLVLRTVQTLRDARQRSGVKTTFITGHMTIVPENIHEIPPFIEDFEQLGFDYINFCYDVQTVPGWLRDRPEDCDRLKEEIAVALKKIDKERVESVQLELLGLM